MHRAGESLPYTISIDLCREVLRRRPGAILHRRSVLIALMVFIFHDRNMYVLRPVTSGEWISADPDNRAGMFVMLASEGTTWEQMMSSYDIRDWVEKAFDVFKTDHEGNRNRTGNEERARGRLFIKFIASMIRIRIQNILRDHDHKVISTKEKKDSVNGMTVDEVILSLSTLMAIGNTGDWRLTAVTKNVRELFRLFGLEEPKSGQIILS